MGAVGVEAGVAVALGEAFAVLAFHEWKMEVGRLRGEVEGAIEEELAGGGVEEVVAADDVGDTLAMVIDDDGELVRRLGAFGPEDEVADGGAGVVGLGAGDVVGEGDGSGRGDEAPVRFFAVKGASFDRWSERGREWDFVGTLLWSGRGGFDLCACEIRWIDEGMAREVGHRIAVRDRKSVV